MFGHLGVKEIEVSADGYDDEPVDPARDERAYRLILTFVVGI